MAQSSSVNTTPKWKRSAATGTLVGVRLQADKLKAIDAWAAKQHPPVTRPEAIRGMIDAVLAKDRSDKPMKKAAQK
jgi:hypothetical protein